MSNRMPAPSTHDFEIPATRVKEVDGRVVLHFSTEPEDFAISMHIACIRIGNNGVRETIGTLSGYVIKRENINFEDMDELSSDAENLVTTLFDEEGSFIAASKHDFGLFGHELEGGDILLIEQTNVVKEHMRKGIGRAMVELAVMNSNHFFSAQWAFAWAVPTGLEPGEQEPDGDKGRGFHGKRSETFFRELGFRQVGRTHWLCYALQSSHRSHNFDAKADAFEDWYQKLKGR